MYLIVLVTLVISIVSVYTQALAVKAGRLASEQSYVARQMMDWHSAAMSMASSIIFTNAAAYTAGMKLNSCSLSAPLPAVTPAAPVYSSRCPSPRNLATGVIMNLAIGGAVTSTFAGSVDNTSWNNVCVYSPTKSPGACFGGPSTVHLPPGYNTTRYMFYSILYQDQASGTNYVVTWVLNPAVTGANPYGMISLPTTPARTLGITAANLMQQLASARMPTFAYGGVRNNVLVTPSFAYNLPRTAANQQIVSDGSVAIISSPDLDTM